MLSQPKFNQIVLASIFFIVFFPVSIFSQTYQGQYYNQIQQPPPNNQQRTAAFRQEIARFDITVWREGKNPLPISQVPRVQYGDLIKVKMLDEVVGGIKPDQSLYNWTFLVAFVNPNRNKTDENSVSPEVIFRKTGWYREYTFKVPFDSQPLFFIYPKPNYRDKILKLLSKNYEEVQKLGEKTIEIAGAYAQIGMFLNELQGVLSNNYYGYNNLNRNITPTYNNPYNPYNPYNNNPYNNYPYNNNYNPNQQNRQPFEFNYNLFMAQTVERLARSFNIQLPQNCWQTNNNQSGYGYNTNNYNNNNYGNYNNNQYNNYNNNYGNYGYNNNSNNFGYGINNDLISRVQCIAKNVRIEDFDVSVSRLLQQGGVLAAAQLAQKYPQIAYWINIAAAAIDLILKITKKTPLRIVPTITQTNGNSLNIPNTYNSFNNQNQSYYNNYQPQNQQNYTSYDNNGGFGNSVGTVQNAPVQQTVPNSLSNQVNPVNRTVSSTSPTANNLTYSKISVYAEAQPDDNQFVTAYPIVIQKWQPNADFDVISLRPPSLADPCLHVGINILKHTDLNDEQLTDTFTREYVLQLSAENGFKKEFSLKKNVGLGGWELNLTADEIKNFPKIQMAIEAVIKGKRGFNEIISPAFKLPVAIGGKWELVKESQDAFAIGARRRVSLRNPLGNCQCLESVIFRPSFGGEFVYETNKPEHNFQYSPDGKEVSFDVDTTNFQAGDGQFELKTFGGESTLVNAKLYPQLPQITEFKVAKGDDQVTLVGENLEQIQTIKVNGRLAHAVTNGNAYTTNPKTSTEKLLQNRTFVFQNLSQKITENSVSLELGLDDNRNFKLPKNFNVQPARPTILTNETKEIEGVAFDQKLEIGIKLAKNQKRIQPQIDLSKYPIFPISTNEIRLIGQNTLTDYDFQVENLTIETRIEKSGGENRFGKDIELPKVAFEVLDFATLKISFQLNEQLQKLLGGRRIQFRLRDSERGDSDWFTIKQTFVRVPKIESVNCNLELSDKCELKGAGIEYISQVSVDSGQTWTSNLNIQPTAGGKTMALIPYLAGKKFLQIKLRDFPKTEGIPILNYEYSPSAILRKTVVQNVAPVTTPKPAIMPKTMVTPTPSPVPRKEKTVNKTTNQTDFLNDMEIGQPVTNKVIKP